jgi:hypothetical protein
MHDSRIRKDPETKNPGLNARGLKIYHGYALLLLQYNLLGIG